MRSRRMRGLWLVVAGAVVVLLLAGCAQEYGARAGGEDGGASSVPSTTVPPAQPPPSTAPARPPTSAAGGNVVAQGTVRQGVEPGCLLLEARDKQTYLLLDADPSKVRPGARVEVVGQRTDQIASFCGEGTVLSVVSVRPLR
jgi:hypothetical protein